MTETLSTWAWFLTTAEQGFSPKKKILHIIGLVQDCSISIAKALEILQSCTKPSIWWHYKDNMGILIWIMLDLVTQFKYQICVCGCQLLHTMWSKLKKYQSTISTLYTFQSSDAAHTQRLDISHYPTSVEQIHCQPVGQVDFIGTFWIY